MANKWYLLFITCLFSILSGKASPPTTVEFIKVDQFGYRTTGQKIAVIADPQTGYNAAQAFNPSTGTNQYQVRRWSDDAVVFSGTITAWSGGATHAQSGDKAWWFDFSSYTTPGIYYVFDVGNNVGSFQFEINDCIYKEALKHAVRTFYYQRCGFAKVAPYAATGFTDGASHMGTQQDTDCRLISNPVVATSKNLSGGWYDAGDYNKYVNFTWGTLIDLLTAYEENPTVWGDNYNIPESGNGIPDLLDEIKFELDWLLKMQQADGSVLAMVGEPHVGAGGGPYSPPSAYTRIRRYGPATTSATLTTSAVFALAAIQFNSVGMTAYATTLQTASINAWNWANANPAVTWTNSGVIWAGENETDAYGRDMRKLSAACFLYKLTGNATYRTYFDANYAQAHLLQWSYAYLFETYEQDVLLYYTKIPGATAGVATAIRNAYSNSTATGNTDNLPSFTGQTDAYRAFMRDANFTWGSNSSKSKQGNMFMNMLTYNLDAGNATNYRNAASGFIHYIHGVNPNTLVFLSNMGAFGAEKSVKSFYHSWFTDGSALWDEVGVSTYGPAPGFLTGGPNPSWSLDGCCASSSCGGSNAQCVTLTPPSSQPVQKSYRDWNANWPQNSWSVTENGIYYQAAYIKLLSKFCSGSCNTSCPTPALGPDVSLCSNPSSVTLNSGVTTGTNKTFSWGRASTTLASNSTTQTTYTLNAPITAGKYWVRVDSTGCSTTDTVELINTPGVVNLGINRNICTPASYTLDAGLSGMTYQWSRATNFAFASLTDINGATSQQLANVRTRGLYRVIVTQGICTAFDTITITSGLPSPVDACIAASGAISLAVGNPGLSSGPFEWYNDPNTGSVLFTGNPYNTTVSTTTTFYVRDVSAGTSASYNVGPATNGMGAVWSSNSGFGATNKLRFDVLSALTLNSVKVYSSQNQNITIRLLASNGSTILDSRTINNIGTGLQTLTLNIPIVVGNGYYLDYLTSATSGNYLDMNGGGASFPYTVPGIISIVESINGSDLANWPTGNGWYHFFYDWQVTAGASCSRLPVVAQVGSCSAGLPLRIVSVYTQRSPNEVALYWVAERDENIQHFIVERSYDGINFAPIATVEATQAHKYVYQDIESASKDVYYRVIQQDYDGMKYTSEITYSSSTSGYIRLFPNPTTQNCVLTVNTGTPSFSYELYDMLGTLMQKGEHSKTGRTGTIELAFDSFAAGVYMVRVVSGTEVFSEKLIIQK